MLAVDAGGDLGLIFLDPLADVLGGRELTIIGDSASGCR